MKEKTKTWNTRMGGMLKKAQRLQSVIGLLAIFSAGVLFGYDERLGRNIFLDAGNLTDILRQVSEIGIIALAMTFVIITAGIDLSVGSMLALSASVTAAVLTQWSPGLGPAAHILLAVAVAMALCGALGAVNGCVIAYFRMQPFIVTLAAMIGVRGLAKWLTRNENIDVGFGDDVGALFARTLSSKPLVITIFIVLAMIFAFILARTIAGRYIRAVGDNEQAARYAGLPIRRVQIFVYTLSGLMAGLAGVVHCAQNHQGSPNTGMAYELEAIAAVVIGGTSLAGGRGAVTGTIVGTLIMGILTNIFRLNNVDSNVEMMVKAVIIIVAVRLQQRRSR